MNRLILPFIMLTLFSYAIPHYVLAAPAEKSAPVGSHSFYDVDFSWETSQQPGTFVISGIAKNVRFNQMYDLELRVSLKNSAGKTIASGAWTFIPPLVRLDEASQFEIRLSVPAGEKPSTAVFSYSYRAGDDPEEISTGLNSFSVPVP